MAMQADIELDFRAAMRRLAATVSVVTSTDAQGNWHGITATSVTSVSMTPATLLVCVNQSASLHNPLRESGRFCVNMLTRSQVGVAQAFGGKLKGGDRFKTDLWDLLGDQPALRGAQANLLCTITSSLVHGSHSIFLGRVDSVRVHEEISPLIYHDGGYSMALPLAAQALAA
jgi:flavin reductase (DIM6/NTAB) family NADH-FMN oxidoreductase RutF